MSLVRLGPISVKNLLKCSAMLFKFSISLFLIQFLLRNFVFELFFPNNFFNQGPCFPYIIIVFDSESGTMKFL